MISYQEDQGMSSQYCDLQYREQQYLRHQEQYAYECAKSQLDLSKQQQALNQRLEFEEKSRQLRLNYNVYQQMMGSTVYKDSDGKLIYAISDSEGEDIRSRVLFNVNHYESTLYLSYFPKVCAVLEISWDATDRNNIDFLYGNDGLSPDVFLKRLKARGLLMSVSSRMEKEAAKALLAYSINGAKEVELPFFYGWNKNRDGKWYFVHKDKLTMKEVLENV